jgi:uncharacterized protein YbjT (DUF2867 family)
VSVLVTGSTGSIGHRVVSGLLHAGEEVRALTRDPAAAEFDPRVGVVAGDLTAVEVPEGLLDGVRQVFVFPATGGVAAFVAAAARAGVQRLVVLSSLAAAGGHERDLVSMSGVHHREIEAQVAASGLPATVLRPGTFDANLLFWAPAIRSTGGVEGPYPTARQAPVHEADVADVAVAALLDERHRDRVYALTGPEALSQVEQLDTIGRAIGRDLTYRRVAVDAYRESMARYMPLPAIDMLLAYWSDTVTEPDVVRSAEPITGRARSLAEWAEENAGAFR